MATTAPPLTGRFSTPVMVNFNPCARHRVRASPMMVPYTGSTLVSLVRTFGTVRGKVGQVSFPDTRMPVPDVVSALADGRPVRAVWVNGLGGVTFTIDSGAEYVKTCQA